MKTLFLVRHAKSSWAVAGMQDFDRPLNERGERDAPLMAGIFGQKEHMVDMILASPAKRALTTARAFAKAINLPEEKFKTDRTIYEATQGTLAGLVSRLPDAAHSVMMFGHNPGFSMLLYHFTGENLDMPTCAIAEVVFEVGEWNHCIESSGKLRSYDFPRRYFPKS